MYDSTPDNTESIDPISDASNLTTALLDTVEHLQSEARGDQGASIGAVIETVLQHTSHETGTVIGEVNRLLANGEIYRSDGDGKRIKLTKAVADGGLNDATAADHIEGVMTAADTALTKDELQTLSAVVEYLRGGEQTSSGGEN